jgi:type III secretory pathway component EscT
VVGFLFVCLFVCFALCFFLGGGGWKSLVMEVFKTCETLHLQAEAHQSLARNKLLARGACKF